MIFFSPQGKLCGGETLVEDAATKSRVRGGSSRQSSAAALVVGQLYNMYNTSVE